MRKERLFREKGMMLMITLLIVSILGILAVSFLYLSSRDYEAAKSEERSIRAFYSARSGLEYYGLHRMELSVGESKRIKIETEADNICCDILVKEDGVISTGIVLSESGEELHHLSLRAPYGDISRWYEVEQ